MITVTGASGHLGRLVIDQLLQKVPASQIVAAVRTPEKAKDLAGKGVSVRTAEYDQPQTLAAAFDGAQKLLLISSSDPGKRMQQHQAAIAAARSGSVELLVYTSILHASTSSISLAVDHHRERPCVEVDCQGRALERDLVDRVSGSPHEPDDDLVGGTPLRPRVRRTGPLGREHCARPRRDLPRRRVHRDRCTRRLERAEDERRNIVCQVPLEPDDHLVAGTEIEERHASRRRSMLARRGVTAQLQGDRRVAIVERPHVRRASFHNRRIGPARPAANWLAEDHAPRRLAAHEERGPCGNAWCAHWPEEVGARPQRWT